MDDVFISSYSLHHYPAISRMFDAVVESDPEYLPEVSEGKYGLDEWFFLKPLSSALVAWRDGRPVGFVGLRRHGTDFDPELEWELCRLAVHPEVQGRGIGNRLVASMEDSVRGPLWCTCVEDSRSHGLFLGRGWRRLGGVSLVGDPAPGVALATPIRS